MHADGDRQAVEGALRKDMAMLGAYLQTWKSRGTMYSYFEIGLKPEVVSCLANVLAPPPIMIESCSRA